MPSIHIIEDDEDIRELITYALEASGFQCQSFDSGENYLAHLEDNPADLLLLDIMLPGQDGLTLLDKLKQTDKKDLPVILLTAKGSEADKVKGLNLGADDYITKPFGITELIARINAVLRRTQKDKNQQDQIRYKDLLIDLDQHKLSVDGEEIPLTYMEFELLKYLALNPNIVLSRDKLMDTVWGYNQVVESRTVDMHIKTLRKKLGPSGSHIKTVRNVGYKLGE